MGKAKGAATDPNQDLTAAASLVVQLIQDGEKPRTMVASKMWDPDDLALWYAQCRTLSMYLGKGNIWESVLCSFDPAKIQLDDRNFHTVMFQTLNAIKAYLDKRSKK